MKTLKRPILCRKIAEIIHVSIASLNHVVKMKREKSVVTPKQKGQCKRKRITPPGDDAYLVMESVKDPRTSDAIKTTLRKKE